MIDIHIHSKYSDGDKSVEEILKICEKKNLEYISITDHNTCKQYKDDAIVNNDIFTGKIIKGAELAATFKNKKIEILAYNIEDTEVIEDWSNKFFSKEILKKQQEESKNKLLSVCDKKGLIYDRDKIEEIQKNIPLTDYITIYIYNELIKHKENIDILGEFSQSLSIFIRKGLTNPDSEYYTESNNIPKPMYKDVINVIHNSGGLAFLAHPYEYRFNDTIRFINELREEKELDGIECFHPSAVDIGKDNILVKYAQDNNLYISGGSDFHGDKKPNIEIGTGSGNLNISKKIIEEWIN